MVSQRGKKVGMIFQEPMTSLNPLLTIGFQMREMIMLHRGVKKDEADRIAIEYLRKAGIANPESRMKQYTFELSGGLRQRVMIAMMLSAQPSLLIADEPTTALDVTIQKQVLKLLADLKKDMNAGVLFITHDLGVVAEIADLHCGALCWPKGGGRLCRADLQEPATPLHDGPDEGRADVDADEYDIHPIPGNIPAITDVIPGCRFNPRCSYAAQCPKCCQEAPETIEVESGHFVACHLAKAKKEEGTNG